MWRILGTQLSACGDQDKVLLAVTCAGGATAGATITKAATTLAATWNGS